MKQFFIVFLLFTIVACNKDDDGVDPIDPYNYELIVEIGEITSIEATISWNAPLQSEWGNVVYKVVLNNEVIADGLQDTNFTITNLNDNRGYNGTVFAYGSNGKQTFTHFNFTTLPYTIHYGTLRITTQEEVNNFYYTECYILIISGINITDLSPMASLQKVNASLVIDNTSISTLDGLDNLHDSYSGGSDPSISITNNPQLENVTALHNYFLRGNNIYIRNNSSLQNLNGMELKSNVTSLIIHNCPITTLPNFGNSTFGTVSLENLPLQDLSAFRYTSEMFAFYVRDMPLLTGFSGLDSLESLWEIVIDGNPNITNLSDLETLSYGFNYNTIGVFINNNPRLRDFCGISQWMNNNEIFIECTNPDCTEHIIHYNVENNAYNPTEEQIKSETECSI